MVVLVTTSVAGCTSTSSSGIAPTVASTTGTPTVVTPLQAPGTARTPSTPTAAPPAAGVGPVLPDPSWTPGAIDPDVSPGTIERTICVAGWTATVRPPESYTEEVKRLEAGRGGTVSYDGVTYQVHGFDLPDPEIGHYELDHLVPLELGGAPADPRNLWMEPYEAPKGPATPGTGSQTKDEVEDSARAAVCRGRLSLADAQREIATDWYQLGRALGAIGTR